VARGREDLGAVASTATRSFVSTAVLRIIRLLVSLAAAAILARLIGPAEYGIYGLVSVAFGLVLAVNDFGLVASSIQRSALEDDEANSVFWLEVVLSLGVAILCLCLGFVFSIAYAEPRLASLIYAHAPVPLFMAAMSQHLARLQREMRIAVLNMVELGTMSIGAAAAIVAAMYGWSYWSLVLRTLLQYGLAVPVYFAISGWRPGMPSIDRSVIGHVRFAGPLFGRKVLQFAAKASDKALLGVLLPAYEFGLYFRATSILATPLGQVAQPFQQVLIPALSRVKDNKKAFRAIYLENFMLFGTACIGLATFIALSAEAIVLVLLGPDWLEATNLMLLASVGAALFPLSATSNWILLPTGKTGLVFKIGLVSNLGLLLVVVATAPFGAYWVAGGRSAWVLLEVSLVLLLAGRVIGLTAGMILDAVRSPLVGALLTLAIGALAKPWSAELSPGMVMLVHAVLLAATIAMAMLMSGDYKILASQIQRLAPQSVKPASEKS